MLRKKECSVEFWILHMDIWINQNEGVNTLNMREITSGKLGRAAAPGRADATRTQTRLSSYLPDMVKPSRPQHRWSSV